MFNASPEPDGDIFHVCINNVLKSACGQKDQSCGIRNIYHRAVEDRRTSACENGGTRARVDEKGNSRKG